MLLKKVGRSKLTETNVNATGESMTRRPFTLWAIVRQYLYWLPVSLLGSVCWPLNGRVTFHTVSTSCQCFSHSTLTTRKSMKKIRHGMQTISPQLLLSVNAVE